MAAFQSLGGFIATFAVDPLHTASAETADCTVSKSHERYLKVLLS